MSGQGQEESILDAARTLWHQGLLHEAESTLRGLGEDALLADRAAAELLLGNIAYERGDYGQSVHAWEAALTMYQDGAGAEAGTAAALGNLEMARARIARNSELEREASHLALLLAAVLLLAVVAVLVASLRSRRAVQGDANP